MASPRTKFISRWKKCESCQTILGQNDVEFHTKFHCPPINSKNDWSYGYIYEKKLHSFLKQFEPQGQYMLVLLQCMNDELNEFSVCR